MPICAFVQTSESNCGIKNVILEFIHSHNSLKPLWFRNCLMVWCWLWHRTHQSRFCCHTLHDRSASNFI